MQRIGYDDIPTPSTSRSNSTNDEEERASPTEDKVQTEPSSPKDITIDVAEQIKETIASKRNTFISSPSASSSSESETDFVAVDKKDIESPGSISVNAVSLLTD